MKTKPKVHKFEAAVRAIVKVSHYWTTPEQGRVHFEVHEELDFPTIHKISKVLGTEQIKLTSGYSAGGCNTCSFGDDWWFEVEAKGVKF